MQLTLIMEIQMMNIKQENKDKMENNWLNNFLRRMNDASQGRLPIINNYNGLDFNLKKNPKYLCEVCVRY